MNDLADERNIVLLSDHADSCLLLETLLRTRLDCQATIASDFASVLKFAEDPDIVSIVIDLQMPKDEIRFIEMLNARKIQQPIFFYSNDPPSSHALRRTEIIVEFVKKPESKTLIRLISEAFGWPVNSYKATRL